MKKRLIALVAVLVLIVGGAFAASGASYYQQFTHVGDPFTYTIDPAGAYAECPAGQNWYLRSYTHNFGPLDSTGHTTLRIYKYAVGPYSHQYVNVEHDGVTRTLEFPAIEKAAYFQVVYDNLNSAGDATITAFCDD